MKEAKSLKLIQYLKNEPEKFYNEGRSYQLLQEFRKGRLSIDTLSELFYFENKWIRRVAIWITSELGAKGGDLFIKRGLDSN